MAFLGCSRGLGQLVVRQLAEDQSVLNRALLSARTERDLATLAADLKIASQILPLDFSKTASIDILFEQIQKLKVSRLFYFVGGGPYGAYGKKMWKDHQWAFQVNFLTAAEILHRLCQNDFSFVRQIVFVGSQIADDKADPQAASYAASKHALKGLIESILQEGLDRDLRLYRPGYMDTKLLPKNAEPRTNGKPLVSADLAATDFIQWVLDPQGEAVRAL